MIKRTLFTVAVLVAAMQLMAAPVDVTTAQSKAQNFLRNAAGRFMAAGSSDVRLALAEKNTNDFTKNVYYIFNSNNHFVIVSGEDRGEQILAYGDGNIDVNKIPCNMKALLQGYREDIEYLQANPGFQASLMTPSLHAVDVDELLQERWDQEAPYYNQCPNFSGRSLTGCPATSLAMIFHFWQWPVEETGVVPAYNYEESSWWWSSTTRHLDALPSITFDWNNMLNEYHAGQYSTAQGDAVAALMRYIGQAEHMEYGTDGSGIDADSCQLIVNAVKFFGYDEESVKLYKKTSAYSGGHTNYTDAEWAQMIQDELAEGRPIEFCAISNAGGHAFNVDGYRVSDNKYHVNFGWSGSGNGWFALNAFRGSGSTFNQYQQMVIGIQPPVSTPKIKANVTDLTMECYKGQTATAAFTINGRNLEGDVTLTLNDANGCFSIDANSMPAEAAKEGRTFTVTYAPQAVGTFTATVTATSSNCEPVVINLTGTSPLEIYRPVMLDIDETTVTANAFRADWTDNTPGENVVSRTLEVMTKPAVTLVGDADFSNLPKDNNNHAADAANYLPADWTYQGSHLYLDGGFISPGRGDIINANCDLTGYNKVSVIIKAKNYQNKATDLTVATSEGSKKFDLTNDVEAYLAVLDLGENQTVQIIGGYYPEIQSIQVYGGEIADIAPFTFKSSEQGDGSYRLVEGITGMSYTVGGLLAGGNYFYRVKDIYIDGTESRWSNVKEVTLLAGGDTLRGDANANGNVSIDDVAAIISYLLNGDQIDAAAADCNLNGAVDIDDIAALINYLLNGEW